MGNVFKTQIIATVIIVLLIVHSLYLKISLENLRDKIQISGSSSDLVSSEELKSQIRSQVLIYNRIPKTGSTSFMNVAYELFKDNQFRVVQLHLSHYKNQLTTGDQIQFAQNMSAWRNIPTLYHGHFAYFDPKRVGVDLSPVYINMVRPPLDRLVSHYYFLRYGDDVLVDKVRARDGDTTTFDECVDQQQADCDPRRMWLQIPFFCGVSPACWEPGNTWALDMAKYNLVTQYLAVGVTDQLQDFVEVLEVLLPQFFTGATKFLNQTGKSHIKHTRHKDPLSEKTIKKMKSTRVWKLENEFYNFALKTFNALKTTTFEQRDAKISYYNYEKVRPK